MKTVPQSPTTESPSKYEKAIDTLGNLWIDEDDQAAAAYLHEHFVTRELYAASTDALRKIAKDACDQLTAITAERDRLRQDLEDIRHLNSENYNDAFQIAANAELSKLEELSTLTAERDRLRVAIRHAAETPHSGWTIAQALLRQALNPEDV